MSVIMSERAWRTEVRPARHKLLLLALADYADSRGNVSIGVRAVADRTNLRIEACDIGFEDLCDEGLVDDVEFSQGPDGARFWKCRLTLPALPAAAVRREA